MSKRAAEIQLEMNSIRRTITRKRNQLPTAVGHRAVMLQAEIDDLKSQWDDMQTALLYATGRSDDGRRMR